MILIDSSAWIALFSQHDSRNLEAHGIFKSLLSSSERLLTTDHILDETYTFLLKRTRNTRNLRALDEVIHASLLKKTLTLHWTGQETFEEARSLFFKYADQTFSFTDCVSFAVAKALKIKRVFSFDHDFVWMGFGILPENLT